jgi:hypothetical protein
VLDTGDLAAQGGNKRIQNVASVVAAQDAAPASQAGFHISAWGVGTGGTGFLTPGFNAAVTATEIQYFIPYACRYSQLQLHASGTGTATETITLRKNGVNTALTATLAGGGTTATDLADNVTFAAGDLVSMAITQGVGSANTNITASLGVTLL